MRHNPPFSIQATSPFVQFSISVCRHESFLTILPKRTLALINLDKDDLHQLINQDKDPTLTEVPLTCKDLNWESLLRKKWKKKLLFVPPAVESKKGNPIQKGNESKHFHFPYILSNAERPFHLLESMKKGNLIFSQRMTLWGFWSWYPSLTTQGVGIYTFN